MRAFRYKNFKKLFESHVFFFVFCFFFSVSKKINIRYKHIGYNIGCDRLSFNPITVDNYASFFNCTPVGRASAYMTAPT